MIDERQLFERFHEALDVEPKPGAYDRLRTALLKSPARPQAWFRVTLPRMSMSLLAGVLVVLLAVAAVGIFLSVYRYAHRTVPIHTVPGPVSRMCAQGNLYMATSTVGWQGTRRTADGGVTWRDASPPTPNLVNDPQAQNTCALDALHAWVIEPTGPQAKGAQADHVVVFVTSDGGQTWQQGEPIPVSGNVAAEVDFIDDQHGWLLTDAGADPFVRTLYATTDGGLRWSRVTSDSHNDTSGIGAFAYGCAESGMTFVSPDHGWLTWNCLVQAAAVAPGRFVAATSDGGRTWVAVDLPSLPFIGRCAATPPVFTGKQGVLQAMCPGWTAVYRTSDAGATWTSGSLPALDVTLPMDFVDAVTGFFFSANVSGGQTTSLDLYRSTNGGRDWSLVKKGLFQDQDLSSYEFIDATRGFAIASGAPWTTTDGGKTWTLSPPYRSVGNVVCPLPPNPTGLNPVPVRMFSPSTGWAAGAWRTTDGGALWSNVGPRSVPNRSSGYGEFFLDGTHAWVAQAAGSSTACADHLVVSSTADGGRSWQQGASTHVQLPDASITLRGNWVPSLDFVDANNGWLLVETQSGFAGRAAGPLYRTSDGGLHWALVSAKAGSNSDGCTALGPVSFSSTSTGWMQVRCGNGGGPALLGRLLVSHDGGATWAVQVLAASSCCDSPLPTFFDENHGWIFVSGEPLMLVTADGGSTWGRQALPALHYYICTYRGALLGEVGVRDQILHAPPAAPPPGPQICSDDSIAAVSFISPNQGWAVVAKYTGIAQVSFLLERTDDGGKSWKAVANMPPEALDVPQPSLTFVDASNGFWWTGGSALFSTTDGGHTWTKIQMASR